jgi:branched-chain amino acid aminotransferase
MTQVSSKCWFNGLVTEREASAPSIASINLHLGTSVFDGFIAYWNGGRYYLHRAVEHLVRFREGSARMGMAIPWSVEEMLAGVDSILKLEEPGTQYVRPIAYRRQPELWVTGSEGRPVDVSIFTVRIPRDDDRDVGCQISGIERISARSIPGQTKVSGAYVNSFHARKTAEKAGFQDGLMLDREGRLTEASAANVFVIDGDRLITPPLNPDVFPGITRNVVLEIAASLKIDAIESDLRPEDLRRVQGAFLCSTLMEIRPIGRLDELSLTTRAHPIFNEIVTGFREITHQ